MAFTLEALETDLGLAPGTLTAKSDVAAKWNGYLGEADTQYKTAKQLKDDADALQAVIDDKIKNFSGTEIEQAAQKAYVASLEAQMASLKTQGFNLTIPEKPASRTVDPQDQFRANVTGSLSTMGQILKVNNKYQQIYGKPFPDDLDSLYNEATARRMTVEAYAAQKYDFAGEESRQNEAKTKAREAEIAAAAVNKYKADNPVVAGNPELLRGGQSRFPELKSRPAPTKHENYGGTAAQRIARSVQRSVTALAAAS